MIINTVMQTPINNFMILLSNFTCIKKFTTNMDFTSAIINATDRARLPRFIPATATVMEVSPINPIHTAMFTP